MSEHITHPVEIKRLERSSKNRVIAGVCGGLGRYFDLNPTVFRLGLVVLTLLGGAGILVYIAAVLVMPAEGHDNSIAADVLAERRDHPWPLVGLALAGVALLVLLTRADSWPTIGAGWILILIAGLAVLWASRSDRRGRRILIAVTTFIALIAVIVASAVATAFAWFDVSLHDGVGNRTYTPATVAAVQPAYHLGVGNLRVDLSQVAFTSPTHVLAKVDVGELRVIVPQNTPVVVDAHAKAGNLNVLDRHGNGTNTSLHAGSGDVLYLNLRVGAGNIDVVRAG